MQDETGVCPGKEVRMSRCYNMGVKIENLRPERIEAVKKTASEQWPFEDWFQHDGELSAWGESTLCGGESEEEFSDRLAEAIWKAHGRYCQVTVEATYLEDLPCEEHVRNERHHRKWKRRNEVTIKKKAR